MAQTAVIDVATRVIRIVTQDPAPFVAPSETAVALATNIDLAGGPWKLTPQNAKVQATTAEFNASGYNDAFNASQRTARRTAFQSAFAAVQADVAVPASLKTLLQRWLAVEQQDR